MTTDICVEDASKRKTSICSSSFVKNVQRLSCFRIPRTWSIDLHAVRNSWRLCVNLIPFYTQYPKMNQAYQSNRIFTMRKTNIIHTHIIYFLFTKSLAIVEWKVIDLLCFTFRVYLYSGKILKIIYNFFNTNTRKEKKTLYINVMPAIIMIWGEEKQFIDKKLQFFYDNHECKYQSPCVSLMIGINFLISKLDWVEMRWRLFDFIYFWNSKGISLINWAMKGLSFSCHSRSF